MTAKKVQLLCALICPYDNLQPYYIYCYVTLSLLFGQGYVCMGAALEALGRLEDAEETYRRGLVKDVENVDLKDKLSKLRKQRSEGEAKKRGRKIRECWKICSFYLSLYLLFLTIL